MPDYSREIAEIEDILRSGVRQTVTDGVTVVYDLAFLREELRRLKRLDDASRGKRPIAATIRLDGACG